MMRDDRWGRRERVSGGRGQVSLDEPILYSPVARKRSGPRQRGPQQLMPVRRTEDVFHQVEREQKEQRDKLSEIHAESENDGCCALLPAIRSLRRAHKCRTFSKALESRVHLLLDPGSFVAQALK